MAHVLINNQTHPAPKPVKAFLCKTFFTQLRGLMFRKTIEEHEGLLFVQAHADRVNSAIHMFFMNFDIAVIWLDQHYRVVDVQLARRWRPVYFPAKPAKYFLETHTNRLNEFHPGDQLVVKPCENP